MAGYIERKLEMLCLAWAGLEAEDSWNQHVFLSVCTVCYIY